MSGAAARCLVVDDDHLVAMYLESVIEELGHVVCAVVHDADSAVAAAREHQPDVVFLDVRLRSLNDGVAAAVEIGAATKARIYFVTGDDEPETAELMAKAPHAGVLKKPIAAGWIRQILDD